ncbi:MAG: hypothetical protein ACRD2S_04550 [Terriglobales bacterium]
MKSLLIGALLCLILTAVGPFTQAQTTFDVNTNGTAYADYDPLTASAGPFPASNFGVSANASLGGTDVNLALGGSTSFLFPGFTDNQILVPTISTVNVGYTPGWTGSLTSTSDFSTSATFHASVGPFSTTDNLFSQNLTAVASSSIASGGVITSGAASGTASGNVFTYTYTASAVFASASAGISVGANYQNQINWNHNTQYGVYSWLSTAPNQAPTSAPQFTSVNSGALNYTLQNFGGATVGQQLYLNLEPSVLFGMTVTPSSNLSTPITGNLSAEAFGDTLVNYNFPIATPFNLPVSYDDWDVSGQWDPGFALSVPVMEENASDLPGVTCTDPNANCVIYVVDGNAFQFQNSLGLNGPSSLTNGSDTGMWNNELNGAPPLPDACDPATGICYASTDPNMPVGTATQSSSLMQVPEPGGLTLFVMSLIGTVLFGRRSLVLAIGKC